MVTRPYNTLATIIKTLHGSIQWRRNCSAVVALPASPILISQPLLYKVLQLSSLLDATSLENKVVFCMHETWKYYTFLEKKQLYFAMYQCALLKKKSPLPQKLTRNLRQDIASTRTICFLRHCHLKSLQQPQGPRHHHRTTHTFLEPLLPSFLPWQYHRDNRLWITGIDSTHSQQDLFVAKSVKQTRFWHTHVPKQICQVALGQSTIYTQPL